MGEFLYKFFIFLWLTFVQDGNEVFFRIKRSTQLKKLMNAYCDRQSVDFNSIAFLFDGRRLRAEQTPDEVNLVCSSLVQTQVSSFNCCKVQFCYYAYSLVELSYTKVFKMILQSHLYFLYIFFPRICSGTGIVKFYTYQVLH